MNLKSASLTLAMLLALGLAVLIAPTQSQDPAPEVTPEATAEPDSLFTLVLAMDGVCQIAPDENAVVVLRDGVYNLPDGSLRFPLDAASAVSSYALFTPDNSKVFITSDGVYDLISSEKLLNAPAPQGEIIGEGRYLNLSYPYGLYDLATMQEITGDEADAIRNEFLTFRDIIIPPQPWSIPEPGEEGFEPEYGIVTAISAPDGSISAFEGLGVFIGSDTEPVIKLGALEVMTFGGDPMLFVVVARDTLSVYTLPDSTKRFEVGLPPLPAVPPGLGVMPPQTDIRIVGSALIAVKRMAGGILPTPVGLLDVTPAAPTPISPPLASADPIGTTFVYSVSDGALLYTFDSWGHFTLDGKWFILPDGLYDTQTGERHLAFQHDSPHAIVQFSPDGVLLLRQGDGVYDVETGERLYDLPEHGTAKFSPDSRWLWVRRAGVLDARTGEKYLPTPSGGGNSVGFSSGSRYVVWNVSGTCRLYAAPDL